MSPAFKIRQKEGRKGEDGVSEWSRKSTTSPFPCLVTMCEKVCACDKTHTHIYARNKRDGNPDRRLVYERKAYLKTRTSRITRSIEREAPFSCLSPILKTRTLSAFLRACFSSNTDPKVTKKGTMAHKSMLFMGSCGRKRGRTRRSETSESGKSVTDGEKETFSRHKGLLLVD